MKEFVEILPPNYHRYPLPAHNAGKHILANCGDPEWCLHEGCLHEILPADIAHSYEVTPVPTATEPVIVFDGNAEQYRDQIQVNTELINEELIKSGFDETLAKSYAIIFHDNHTEESDFKVRGWYNKYEYFINKTDQDKNAAGYENHPLVVNVVLSDNEQQMSKFLWHEFGHAHKYISTNQERIPLYNKENNITRTKELGVVAMASGFASEAATIFEFGYHNTLNVATAVAGGALIVAGGLLKDMPKNILWSIDRGEIYANRFAFKRRKLQPITLNSHSWIRSDHMNVSGFPPSRE